MSNQLYRSLRPRPRPADLGPQAERPDLLGEITAPGGGNDYARMLMEQQQAAPESDGGGMSMGQQWAALNGDLHLSELMPAGAQAEFDDSERGANLVNYDRGWFGGADSARVEQIRMSSFAMGGLRAGAVSADGMELTEREAAEGQDAGTLTLNQASVQQIVGEGLQIASASVEGLEVQREYPETAGGWTDGFFGVAGSTSTSVRSVRLEGVQAGGVSAEGVALNDVSGAFAPGVYQDPQATLAMGSVAATGLTAGDASLAALSATELSASAHATDAGVALAASLESAQGSGLVAPGVRADALTLAGGSVLADGQGVQGAASGLGIQGLSAEGAGSSLAAGSASVQALAYARDAAGRQTLSGQGVSLEEAQARVAGSGGSSAELMRELFDLVQSAHVRGEIPLNAGSHGSGLRRMDVPQGAKALVELTVRGNRIVPERTSMDFTPDIDTTLWPKLAGVYITSQGRVFVDVRNEALVGDQDLLEILGFGPNRALPLGLADAASVMSNLPESEGGGTDLLQTDNSWFSTVARLSGDFQSGGVQAQVGNASVSAVIDHGGESVAATVTDLVLNAIGLNVGGAQVDISQVQSDGAQVDVGGSGVSAASDAVTADRATLSF